MPRRSLAVRGERSGGLTDRQAGQGYATERKAEPQRFGEGVCGRSADDPPRPAWCRPRGDRVKTGEHRGGHEVAGRREEPHPTHAREQPGGTEQPTPSESLAIGGCLLGCRLKYLA